jgi:hypothetical protein
VSYTRHIFILLFFNGLRTSFRIMVFCFSYQEIFLHRSIAQFHDTKHRFHRGRARPTAARRGVRRGGGGAAPATRHRQRFGHDPRFTGESWP